MGTVKSKTATFLSCRGQNVVKEGTMTKRGEGWIKTIHVPDNQLLSGIWDSYDYEAWRLKVKAGEWGQGQGVNVPLVQGLSCMLWSNRPGGASLVFLCVCLCLGVFVRYEESRVALRAIMASQRDYQTDEMSITSPTCCYCHYTE